MPNTEGLFMLDTIRGFIAASSDHPDIGNPLSLFQVIPENYEYDNPHNRIEEVYTHDKYIGTILKEKKIIRIDPGRLYKNIRCCDAFRQCKGNKCKDKCFNLDSRIALFYHPDLEDIHYFGNNEKYIETFKRIVYNEYNPTLKEDENGQKDEPLQIKIGTAFDEKNECYYKRIYVTYRCKYSGFDEYFFPIFHSGKVIAVIMQGQRPNPEIKQSSMFAYYQNDPDGGKDLQEALKELSDRPEFWKEESLGEHRREAIFNLIIDFARRINDSVNSISQQYVSNEFQTIENTFRENISKINSTDTNIVHEYKKILNVTLKNIFYTFNEKGFIRIYSLKNNSHEEESANAEFELIGDSEPETNKNYSNLSFAQLPRDKTKIEKEELIKYLANDKKPLIKPRHTFRLEIPFIHKMAHIIWKSYTLKDRKYSVQRKYYGDTLKLFYHVLLEPYIILKQVAFEELLEKSIRVSVHETAQVIPPIIQTLESYFETEKKESERDYDYYKRFHEKFKKDIDDERYFKELVKKIGDINNRIKLLDGLYKRSTLIFKHVEPSMNWEDFHRSIYSLKSLFEEKAFLNNRQYIDIFFDPVFSKCDIWIDKNFISQVLFNLVDNAIKYGLRGSKINIRVKMSETNKEFLRHGIFNRLEKIQIIIENFGYQIEAETHEKIFDLYYRSPKYPNEGLGIGLFLVKRLCNVLGYEIQCKESEFIGNLNYPIYYHYLKQKGSNSLDKLVHEKELTSLVENKIVLNATIDRVVNENKAIDWAITYKEIETQLKEPTYCNRFIITIPINNNIKIN